MPYELQNNIPVPLKLHPANIHERLYFCVRSSIIGGKQVPIKAMVLQEHLLEVREFCGILKWVRMDSGFMSEELLRYLDSFVCEAGKNNKIKFIANVKKKRI